MDTYAHPQITTISASQGNVYGLANTGTIYLWNTETASWDPYYTAQ